MKRVIVSIGLAMALAVGLFAWAVSGGPMANHLPAAPTAALASTVTTATGGAPSTPGPSVCGNATILDGPSTAPAGAVTVPAGTDSSFVGALQAGTTYFLATGTHTLGTGAFDQFQPADDDVFIGAPGAVVSGQGVNDYAFVSNASGVEIEYLTIEDFVAPQSEGVVNQDSGTAWTIRNDTVEDNPHGAGVMLGSDDVLTDSCLTENGQYGFQSYSATGPHTVTVTDNEISDNDTANYTVTTVGCGCTGGAKFWETTGATITGNYVHNNASVGIWADTNNTGFDISDNYFAENYGEAITYEISYNASITDNTFVRNALGIGPTNPGFPEGTIYISESGSDPRVPGRYGTTLSISGNVFTDNWSGVVLWENANRYCGSAANTSTGACTLVDPSAFTATSCSANVPTSTPLGNPDYFDGCRWKTQNVDVTDNTFNFSPADIGSSCTAANSCGLNGIFSQYGTYPPYVGWVVPDHISNDQNDHFADNRYTGPWNFMAFSQGSVVSWAQWSSGMADASASGDPFGAQDAGSTYDGSAPPATTTTTAPPSTTTTTTTTTAPPATTTTTAPPSTTTTTEPPPTTTTTAPPPTTTTVTEPPRPPTTTTTTTTAPPPPTTTTTAPPSSPPSRATIGPNLRERREARRFDPPRQPWWWYFFRWWRWF